MKGKLHSAPQCDVDTLIGSANDESIPVILHPLVVLNVSDHFTRYAAMQLFPEAVSRRANADASNGTPLFTDGGKGIRVLGILLGTQRGRTVEVCHSFELPARISQEGVTEVDIPFMNQRIEQYQQIFANYNVVGWYYAGSEVSADDLRLHTEVFSVLNEVPILLVINPNVSTSIDNTNEKAVIGSSKMDTKPIGQSPGVLVTYQMELKVVHDKPKMILVPVPHRYASEDSERIAVDHVMRHAVPGGGDGTSSTTLHLGTLRRSIKMLKNRVELLAAFLEATASGKIEVNHALLQQVAGVCARLPALDCKEFSEAYADERNDSLLVTYLSGVTKSLCLMSEAVEMFNRFNDRGTPGGSASRRRGVFSRP